MNEYEETYRKFHAVSNDCKELSKLKGGIPSPTAAHYYASLLFTKLCTTSVTLLSITPLPENITQDSHWDSASVATLTRGLIETYLVFFYLCIDECSEDEWKARWRLMNLHDHMSRLKLFKATEGGDSEAEKFEAYTPEVIADLQGTTFFQSLDKKQQKHFLRGKIAFFKSQDEIILAAGGDISEFRSRYIFMSNQAHSFPMAFYRMAESGRGAGTASSAEVSYTSLFISWALECLVKASEEYEALWS